jgi:hypothetical protein
MSMTSQEQLARMDAVGTDSRMLGGDLARWNIKLATGLTTKEYYNIYTKGFLAEHEMPARCKEFGIEAVTKPTYDFNPAANPTLDTSAGPNVFFNPFKNK